MKRMTKEELIEYFIEQLGENEILGNVMSIEQIRKKLNGIIKDVTFEEEIGTFRGSWSVDIEGNGIINFDLTKIPFREQAKVIVHELLHVLSMSTTKLPLGLVTQKCGLQTTTINTTTKKKYHLGQHNTALNEGMTDVLAEMITGTSSDGYNKEKDIYKILAIIVGKDAMIKKFFTEGVLDTKVGTNIFKDELIERYGKDFGNEINNDLRKILHLSDLAINMERKDTIQGLNAIGKKLQDKINDEIYNTLEKMVYKVIENEPDIMKKIQVIMNPGFSTSLDEKIASRILSEVVGNKDIDGKTKLEILRAAGRFRYSDSTNEVLKQVLFETRDFKKDLDEQFGEIEVSDISTEEKIAQYFSIYSGCKEFMKPDKVYDWYVETGKVIPSEPFKKGIFAEIFTDDKITLDKRISDTKYCKIGDYYQIVGKDKYWDKIFDENGNSISIASLYFEQSGEQNIEADGIAKILPGYLTKENSVVVSEKINQIFQDMKKMCPTDASLELGFLRVFGNVIEIQKCYTDNEPIKIYYDIQADGTIEKVELRRRKKICR